MIQINQIEQQVSLTVNPITEVINIEVTEIIHSVYIVAKESPGSPTFNQNNVDVVKTVQTLYSDEPLKWLSNLNELTPYTINEFQSLWVRVISLNQSNVPDKTIIYKVINKGKGDYGLNKTQFILEDLFFVAQSASTLQDIINEETTIVINLGEHTSHVIKDIVNSQNPPILIQNQALGQTIFTVLDDEIVYSYLWIGTAGTYGVANSQSTAADFQVLNDQPQLISNLYVEKAIYSPISIFNTGILDTVELDKRSALKIQGTVSEIRAIQKNNSNFYFIGQPFFLYNDTAGPLKITHLLGTGNIKFFQPELVDYFAQPNEVVLFVLESVGGNLRYRRASSGLLANKSVTLEKLQDIASQTVFGRISPGTGQPELLDAFDLLFMLDLQDVVYDLSLKLTKVSTGSQERVYGVGVDNVQKMISTKEQFVSDADIITALNAITSTVATISVVGKTMYKGQMYVSTSPDYLYVAFDDNLIIRK